MQRKRSNFRAELVQEPLEHTSFDRVGRNEIEDQAIESLAIAVNAAHPLFEAIGIPGYVVVEEDVAALKIDAFARGFSRHQDLNSPCSELLLDENPRARLVAGPRLHAAVDKANSEAPPFELLNKIIERVFELSEKKKALIGMIEEAFFLEDSFQSA